jgi:heat-inducible transcriptional repressor
MDTRKKLILDTIIKEHIKTGVPVGSSILVEKYKLDISPATARNEMVFLEEEGYIIQPHTSAGRVPTEKAYKFYLANSGILTGDSNQKKGKLDMNNLENSLKDKNEQALKDASKIMSALSGHAVFCAFHRHNLYYTGISNLFQQPEFSQLEIIHDISEIIDHIDEIIDEIFETVPDGVQVLIGSENPFGNLCSTIMSKYKLNGKTGLFGILGPMRMNYEKNIALIKYVNESLRN